MEVCLLFTTNAKFTIPVRIAGPPCAQWQHEDLVLESQVLANFSTLLEGKSCCTPHFFAPYNAKASWMASGGERPPLGGVLCLYELGSQRGRAMSWWSHTQNLRNVRCSLGWLWCVVYYSLCRYRAANSHHCIGLKKGDRLCWLYIAAYEICIYSVSSAEYSYTA